MSRLKVEDSVSLVKDVSSGAVLETDINILKQHRRNRMAFKNRMSEIEELKEKVTRLENIIEKLIGNNGI